MNKPRLIALKICLAALPGLFLFLLPLFLQAQNPSGRTVNGTVTTATGTPLSDASITIRGTKQGTLTDSSGNFQLRVPGQGNTTLEISLVGYQTVTLALGSRSSLPVVLQEAASGLNEVVVVGYTSQRKKDLTGAVSVISNRDIASIPVGGVDQIMQGKAAGVSITAATGAPGDAIAVRIRGVGTINDNSPLYVIDGIPTKTGINEISPNDIESINILKDASSAAIYGARASNGVVIVTTKKGRSGKARLGVSAYTGQQTATNLIKMANTSQYIQAYNTAATNDGRALIPAAGQDTLANVNWLKEVLKPASINNLQLNISGGNESSQYIVSGNYYKQEGLVNNSSFQRANVRTAVTSSLSKIFKLGTNINLSYSKNRQVGTSGDGFGAGNPGASVVRYALFRTTATPVYNKAGQYVDLPARPDLFGDGLNPVAFADSYDRNFNNYAVLGNAFAELTPIANLKIRSDIGMNLQFTEYKQFFKTWGIDRFFNSPNSLAQSAANELNYNWTNTATYNMHFGESHALTLLAGSEVIKDDIKQLSASRTTFVDQTTNLQYLDNGMNAQQNGSNESHWALFSLFARADYSFADKYLLNFNVRRDGSSRLSPGKQYGNFFSGSAGWRIDQENFMKNVKQVSQLKLRASVGQLGNQEISNYAYTSLFGGTYYYPFGGTSVRGSSISAEGNPNIKWESSTQGDLGLDLGLFNNTLQLTADYFVKNTTGMLLSIPLPSSAGGVSGPVQNAGKVRNQGLELELTYRRQLTKDLHFTGTANFATIQNKVLSIAYSNPIVGGRIDNNYYATLTTVGHPIGAFYLLNMDGIFQTPLEVFTHAYQGPGIQPGDVKFKDISGPGGKKDGVINEYDRSFAGSPIPKFTYGFTGSFEYRHFDLSVFLQGVYGNSIYNQIRTDIEGFYRSFNITERVALNSWHGQGTSNEFPRLSWTGATNNKQPSTRFLESGSYMRVKNVQLGYNVPANWLSVLGISQTRVFVSAQNLFTFTKYTGLDPEQYTSNNSLGDGVRAVGIDWGTYPSARIWTAGINVNF